MPQAQAGQMRPWIKPSVRRFSNRPQSSGRSGQNASTPNRSFWIADRVNGVTFG